MKILLAVGCFWVASLVILQPPNDKGTAKQNGAGDTNQASKSEHSQASSGNPFPSGTVVNCYQEAESASHDCHKEQSSEDIEIQRKLAKFTKYLVWVGGLQFVALILQAVVFYFTLKKIGTQAEIMQTHADHLDKLAKAARDNATAALLNAQAASKSVDAIIRSERAWVIAELFPMAKKKSGQYFRWVGGGNAVPMEPERILRGEHLQHGLKFVNMGRTMARITAFEFHCGFYDHKRDALRVERIDYNGDYNRMLAAGDEVSTDVVIDIHEFVHNPGAEIGPPTWKNWIVVLVSVTYDHVFISEGPQDEIFRFIFDIQTQAMRRIATAEGDKEQIGKREIWPKTEKPN